MPLNSDQPFDRQSTDLIDKTVCRLQPIDRPLVLSIEGNIGAGKSTFLKLLINHFGEDMIEILPEPVDAWTDCAGHNLLQAFYGDATRYAYTFQTFAVVTRLMQQQSTPQLKPIRILERSALSDRLFARNCHADGLMSGLEWAAYDEWWQFFTRSVPGAPDGMVYLATTPETCFERMSIRNRSEEKGVPIEYLRQLHERHEEWLRPGTCADQVHAIRFARVDADVEFEKDLERQKVLMNAVVELINDIISKRRAGL